MKENCKGKDPVICVGFPLEHRNTFYAERREEYREVAATAAADFPRKPDCVDLLAYPEHLTCSSQNRQAGTRQALLLQERPAARHWWRGGCGGCVKSSSEKQPRQKAARELGVACSAAPPGVGCEDELARVRMVSVGSYQVIRT